MLFDSLTIQRCYLGIETHALFAVEMDVPSYAATTTGEGKEGQRDGDRHVDAHL